MREASTATSCSSGDKGGIPVTLPPLLILRRVVALALFAFAGYHAAKGLTWAIEAAIHSVRLMRELGMNVWVLQFLKSSLVFLMGIAGVGAGVWLWQAADWRRLMGESLIWCAGLQWVVVMGPVYFLYGTGLGGDNIAIMMRDAIMAASIGTIFLLLVNHFLLLRRP